MDLLVVGAYCYRALGVFNVHICETCWECQKHNLMFNTLANCKVAVTEMQLRDYIDTWQTFEALRKSLGD